MTNPKLFSLELFATERVLECIPKCTRSLTVLMLVQYEEWDQIAQLDVDPCNYNSYEDFRDSYLATSLLRKSPNLPTSFDRTKAASEAFFEAEELCRNTNATVQRHGALLHEVSRECTRILGDLNGYALRFIEEKFSFGPGATFRAKGQGIATSDKYDYNLTLTRDLIAFARSILGTSWAESQKSFEVVPGNKFATVPKNAKTDRGICIEPSMNIYVQKGIGSYLKTRLAFTGNSLHDGQDRHAEMAHRAYRDRLATIDLSMASDTVSLELVRELLPPTWFLLLDTARSRMTRVQRENGQGDCWIENQKFSSMGNGFTFELETLIFLSVTRAIVPIERWNDVSVYGDDIICPQEHATEVSSALELLGFKVNHTKSFLAGNFFES